MPTYIALLRAVNVGGANKLPMADFRKLLEALGFERVTTYIQSGNAIFDSACGEDKVARDLAAGLEDLMGRPVPFVLLSNEDLTRILSGNPFHAEAAAEGGKVHAFFFSARPSVPSFEGLASIPKRSDRYHATPDALYLHLPEGAAETKFTARAIERFLGVHVTARNWNTVLQLHAMSKRHAESTEHRG